MYFSLQPSFGIPSVPSEKHMQRVLDCMQHGMTGVARCVPSVCHTEKLWDNVEPTQQVDNDDEEHCEGQFLLAN